ncbi:MAG: putative O-glycosylation ligase, exosortase A system-associated [Alphaproteobacteria bacterium]|nr:putative O-glycosylation ligase, exosortase A system-associated [Alphaproteobacteria bacterium]
MRDALLLGIIASSLLLALRYPYVGVLTWAWFSIMNPQQLAYGVYGVPLNVIIAAVTVLSIIVNGETKRFRIGPITVLFAAFALWLWVSQLFSLDHQYSAAYFSRFIKVLFFAALCEQMTTDKLRLHALVWTVVIAVGFFALKGGVFTLLTLGRYHVQGIEHTIMEDNNQLGIIIASGLPLILYLYGESRRRYMRVALLCLFSASVVAILGTQSRGAFVALLAFAAFFWLRAKRKLTILVALIALLAPAIAFMPQKWAKRMETITQATEDASFMGRVDSWIINTELALKHPLTGAGLRNAYQPAIAATVDPERAPRAKAAHSIYFEVLGGAGFIGLAVYLSLLAAALWTAARLQQLARDPTVEAWVPRFGCMAQAYLVVFGVGAATVSLEMWDGYLILIGLLGALARWAPKTGPQIPAASFPPRYRWRVLARGYAPPRPRALEK